MPVSPAKDQIFLSYSRVDRDAAVQLRVLLCERPACFMVCPCSRTKSHLMQHATAPYVSIEEYLQGEPASEVRHEYIDGQVYAMAGAGERHNLISGNLYAALRPKARTSGCKLFMADMKLRIRALKRFYYPDLLLTCNPFDGHEFYKEHPCLVIEVLSTSTEGTDRREKWQAYQTIASLQEYVLVAQERQQIEIYRRDEERWQHITLDASDPVYLGCLDLELSMAGVYEDVF